MDLRDSIAIEISSSEKLTPLVLGCLAAVIERLTAEDVAGAQTIQTASAAYLNAAVESADARQFEFGMTAAGEFGLLAGPQAPLIQSLPPQPAEPAGSAAGQPEPLGAGLFLVRRMVDELSYQPTAQYTRWRLVKHLGQPLPVETGELRVLIELPAHKRYLNILGMAVHHLLAQVPGLENLDEASYNLQLAVQEIAMNIIYHAYHGGEGRFQVILQLTADGTFVVESRDQGSVTFDLAMVQDAFSPPKLPKAPGKGLLRGGLIFFLSATVVNAGNYFFNLVLGRWLGPAAFADLSLLVTLFLMVTFVTITFQLTAARFAAVQSATRDWLKLASTQKYLRLWAYGVGAFAVLILVPGAKFWQEFFHTQSPWPFVILAVGLPFYLAQGVDRGVLQGRTRFGWLSLSYQAEMWSRLALGVAFVALGWSVNGAVGAITLSIFATWLVALRSQKDLPRPEKLPVVDQKVVGLFAFPVILAELSQILINNSDILIVKRFFEAEAAGQYAALALIGRIVFFATWSVVTTLFPIVAQRQEKNLPHRHLLGLAGGLVVVVAGTIITATLLFPELIVQILFGEAYLGIAGMLWAYGVATALYALANVVINYRLSLGFGSGSTFALVAGFAQVVGLWLFHASLEQVIYVQIGIMAVLLVVLLGWDYWLHRKHSRLALAGI